MVLVPLLCRCCCVECVGVPSVPLCVALDVGSARVGVGIGGFAGGAGVEFFFGELGRDLAVGVCGGLGAFPGFGPALGDFGGGHPFEEQAAEFVEGEEGDGHEDEGERITGREEGGEDDADHECVSAVFGEPLAVDEAEPAEEENDDGHLEAGGEGEGEGEDKVDVFADFVLGDDASAGGVRDADDDGDGAFHADAEAFLAEDGVEPLLADGGCWRIAGEDGDGGEDGVCGDFGGDGGRFSAEVGGEVDEEGEGDGEDDFVEEGDADDAERETHGEEDADEAFFVVVKTRGDEEPDLVEDPGDADDDGDDDGDFEVGVEGLHGAGGLEGVGEAFVAELQTRGFDDKREERLPKESGDDEDGEHAEEGRGEAAAQLFEVIAEGHAGGD